MRKAFARLCAFNFFSAFRHMIRSFVFIPLVCAFWGRAFCLFGRPGGGGGGGAGLLCLGFDAFAAGGGADGEGAGAGALDGKKADVRAST